MSRVSAVQGPKSPGEDRVSGVPGGIAVGEEALTGVQRLDAEGAHGSDAPMFWTLIRILPVAAADTGAISNSKRY